MIHVRFPDGAEREYPEGSRGADITGSISKSLLKRAMAMKVAGTVRDLSAPVPDGASLEILTRDAPGSLGRIRHDAAHVMAEAVQELWPGTQVTIGPVIENGFYDDFKGAPPLSGEEVPAIEKKKHE